MIITLRKVPLILGIRKANFAMKRPTPPSIEAYISQYPADTQKILEQMRATIRKVAPAAEEAISYGIPSFRLNGTYLIYFAAYAKHVGVYPVPRALEQIDKKFARYQTSGKGTIQFPLNEPMPWNLIGRLVKRMLAENTQRAAAKKQKRTTR
jgi:uncharacterized protein YdhG (YjbR/CyaY superfamily)